MEIYGWFCVPRKNTLKSSVTEKNLFQYLEEFNKNFINIKKMETSYLISVTINTNNYLVDYENYINFFLLLGKYNLASVGELYVLGDNKFNSALNKFKIVSLKNGRLILSEDYRISPLKPLILNSEEI